jgi:hypothetical protein
MVHDLFKNDDAVRAARTQTQDHQRREDVAKKPKQGKGGEPATSHDACGKSSALGEDLSDANRKMITQSLA